MIMSVSVAAARPMLMPVVLMMVGLVMMSVIMLAPRTMLMMRLFGVVLMSFLVVVRVLVMLMRVVVFSSTTEEEGGSDCSHSEGSSVCKPESFAGKDSHEADGGSQHYLTNNNCDQLPTLSLLLSKSGIKMKKEGMGRDRTWKITHIII